MGAGASTEHLDAMRRAREVFEKEKDNLTEVELYTKMEAAYSSRVRADYVIPGRKKFVPFSRMRNKNKYSSPDTSPVPVAEVDLVPVTAVPTPEQAEVVEKEIESLEREPGVPEDAPVDVETTVPVDVETTVPVDVDVETTVPVEPAVVVTVSVVESTGKELEKTPVVEEDTPSEEMVEGIPARVLRIRNRKSVVIDVGNRTVHRFVVAVDGSECSEKAFRMALSLMKGLDTVTILHVIVPGEEEFGPRYNSARLMDNYDTHCIGNLPKDRFKLVTVPLRNEKESVKSAVVRYMCSTMHSEEPSFLVTGYSGRKNADEEMNILGSTADLALRYVPCPSIIVKTQKAMPDQSRSVVVLVSGRERDAPAYDLVHTIIKATDRVTVVHINDGTSEGEESNAKMREYYTYDLNSRGIQGSYVSVPKEGGVAVHKLLAKAVTDADADIAVFTARLPMFAGSIADHLMREISCTVLVAKDDHH